MICKKNFNGEIQGVNSTHSSTTIMVTVTFSTQRCSASTIKRYESQGKPGLDLVMGLGYNSINIFFAENIFMFATNVLFNI